MDDEKFTLNGLSIDFALVKVKPPIEFTGVGRALTQQRRQTAEGGTHHRTARWLGALFSDVNPNTPLLIKAFGSRASEIIQSPQANRKGTTEDGPFKEYVGADATAIWASATSGVASIAVLLLACMLARKFDDHRFTVALWVEVVRTKQSELLVRAEANGSISDTILAKQPILREDLAAFDSSVRSWLRTADIVMDSQQKRLDPILYSTASDPVSTGDSTYSKVLKAWRDAMEGFEALLGGVPQRVSEASLLLALSAWHIYPDLILLPERLEKVEFQDALIPRSGVITVGLQLSDSVEEGPGFRWSLTLSHLRYYGTAVEVNTKSNNFRINMQELQVIVFGALLRAWEIPHADAFLTAACVQEIATLLKALPKTLPEALPANVQHVLSGLSNSWFPWYDGIFSSSKSVSALLKLDPKRCNKLLQHGRRRFKTFFEVMSKRLDGVLFGLSNPHILRAISLPPGLGRDLSYCRSLLSDVKEHWTVIIAYRFFVDKHSTKPTTILATTRPLGFSSKLNDQNLRTWVERHCRWVVLDEANWHNKTELGVNDDVLSLLDLPQDEDVEILKASNQQSKDGSQTLNLSKDGSLITWYNAPDSYRYPPEASNCTADESMGDSCSCFGSSVQCQFGISDLSKLHSTAVFERVCGDENGISLFCSKHHSSSTVAQRDPRKQLVEHVRAESTRTLSMGVTLENLRKRPPDNLSLTLYFILLTQCKLGAQADITKLFDLHLKTEISSSATNNEERRPTSSSVPDSSRDSLSSKDSSAANSTTYDGKAWTWNRRLMRLDMGQGGLWWNHWRLWSTLNFISAVFENLPGSTFPLKIADRPFPLIVNHKSQHTARSDLSNKALSQALACIATMEVGGTPFDPKLFERAFALSIGNSLYVSELLLGDPLADTKPRSIRRIPGNLDHPGMSILLCPQELRSSEALDFEAINHLLHDGQRLNMLQDTSLHLSLLDRKVPVHHGLPGLVDQDVFLIESVISVHSKGKWYADIDVLKALPLTDVRLKTVQGTCSCGTDKSVYGQNRFVSIDNFDELLDPPVEIPAIVRSRQNWVARLAALCIVRQKFGPECVTVVAGEDVPCYKCLADTLRDARKSSPAQPSGQVDLPRIVID